MSHLHWHGGGATAQQVKLFAKASALLKSGKRSCWPFVRHWKPQLPRGAKLPTKKSTQPLPIGVMSFDVTGSALEKAALPRLCSDRFG